MSYLARSAVSPRWVSRLRERALREEAHPHSRSAYVFGYDAVRTLLALRDP